MWINGPVDNAYVTWLNVNTNERGMAQATVSDILDVSIDLFDDRIFVLSQGEIMTVSFVTGLATEFFQFAGQNPIALDVFEIYSYVLLDTGRIMQINNRETTESRLPNCITLPVK